MLTKSRLFQTQTDDCRLKSEDLKRLDQVSEVLTLLNDPYIGPYKLADCVEALPVLANRCRREAALHRPRNEVENIERALNVLGNRGIEKVLLELLEDMTLFKSELETASPATSGSPSPQAPNLADKNARPAGAASSATDKSRIARGKSNEKR